jgi:uncharacterized protein
MNQRTSDLVFSELIDVNVYVSRWPFRRLPLEDPARLADALAKVGVSEAWIGNFDALLHRDVAAVNLETAAACKQYGSGSWRPVGSVNPTLPDWKDDLRRCHEQHGMSIIRLHPNYHNYKLDDADCLTLLGEIAQRGWLVQIAVSMEDERTQHPLLQVPRVDHRPLKRILQEIPSLRVMLLNVSQGVRFDVAESIGAPGRVWFDVAMLEGIEGVARLVKAAGAGAVVYGSLTPLFYQDAALLKLQESGLAESLLSRIAAKNAAEARAQALQ